MISWILNVGWDGVGGAWGSLGGGGCGSGSGNWDNSDTLCAVHVLINMWWDVVSGLSIWWDDSGVK